MIDSVPIQSSLPLPTTIDWTSVDSTSVTTPPGIGDGDGDGDDEESEGRKEDGLGRERGSGDNRVGDGEDDAPVGGGDGWKLDVGFITKPPPPPPPEEEEEDEIDMEGRGGYANVYAVNLLPLNLYICVFPLSFSLSWFLSLSRWLGSFLLFFPFRFPFLLRVESDKFTKFGHQTTISPERGHSTTCRDQEFWNDRLYVCFVTVSLFRLPQLFLGFRFRSWKEKSDSIQFNSTYPIRPLLDHIPLIHTYQTTTVRHRVNIGRRGKRHRWTDEGGQSFSLPAFSPPLLSLSSP